MFNMKNLTKKIVVALVAISLVPATSTLALAHGGHHGGAFAAGSAAYDDDIVVGIALRQDRVP